MSHRKEILGQGEGSWQDLHLVQHGESLSERHGFAQEAANTSIPRLQTKPTKKACSTATPPMFWKGLDSSLFVGCPLGGHSTISLGIPRPPWTLQQTHQGKASKLSSFSSSAQAAHPLAHTWNPPPSRTAALSPVFTWSPEMTFQFPVS